MRTRAFASVLVCQVLFLLVVSASWSQQVPAQLRPGAIERSLEPEAFPEPAEIPEVYIETQDEGRLKGAAGVQFLLKGINFEGNAVISEDALQSLTAEYIGSQISVDQLSDITDRITRYYKQQGYILSRAYLPPQTIQETVTIKIREGRLGRVIVQGNQRYSDQLIDNTLKLIENRGAVNIEDVERGLLLLMDIPGLSVRATFKPGEAPGTTDLVIDASEDRPFHIGFDYNNYGTEAVSEHRFGVFASVTNLTGRGDMLRLRTVTGEKGFSGLFYNRLEFQMPIGYEGLRLGTHVQYLKYELQEEFEALDYEGDSFAAGFWLRYPIIRTRQLSWWVDGGLEVRNQDQEMFGQNAGEDKLRPFSFGTTVNVNDRFNGANSFRLETVFNQDTFLGGSDEDDADDMIRTDSDTSYFKAILRAERYQFLPAGMGLMLSGYGQISGDRLPSSEQIALGGPGTVRGYEQSEYSGDTGGYVTAELRLPLFGLAKTRWFGTGKTIGETLQFALFADYGGAVINDDLPGEMDNVDMFGAGAGLRFSYSPYFFLSFDYARSVGGEDPQDEDVKDNGVFYIQASVVY